MSYEHQHFPKWKYHATLPARIVANYEEEEALGDEWADRPDSVKKPDQQDEPALLSEAKTQQEALDLGDTPAADIDALDPKTKPKRK